MNFIEKLKSIFKKNVELTVWFDVHLFDVLVVPVYYRTIPIKFNVYDFYKNDVFDIESVNSHILDTIKNIISSDIRNGNKKVTTFMNVGGRYVFQHNISEEKFIELISDGKTKKQLNISSLFMKDLKKSYGD